MHGQMWPCISYQEGGGRVNLKSNIIPIATVQYLHVCCTCACCQDILKSNSEQQESAFPPFPCVPPIPLRYDLGRDAGCMYEGPIRGSKP